MSPPVAVKVAELPLQTTVGLLEAVIVGDGFTTKFIVLVAVQEPIVPVTVYIVEEAGLTVIDAPTKPPGFQV